MNDQHLIKPVLAAFRVTRWESIESLGGSGGFSGARFWRIYADLQQLCLRCWPPSHPSPERLEYIHRVLQQVGRSGLSGVPVPLLTTTGETFLRHAGHLWELTSWLPGQANYRRVPRPRRLTNAMRYLAEFHLAAADGSERGRSLSRCPAISQRLELLQQWLAGEWQELEAAVGAGSGGPFAEMARRILMLFMKLGPRWSLALAAVRDVEVEIQPCIRDVWHEHVLFHGDTVTGVVDFGAMRDDSVAVDIARLLGSLTVNDDNAWKIGFAAYERRRAVSPAECRLIDACQVSEVLLAGMNWLRWLYLERRRFDEPQRVKARLEEAVHRLESLSLRKSASLVSKFTEADG